MHKNNMQQNINSYLRNINMYKLPFQTLTLYNKNSKLVIVTLSQYAYKQHNLDKSIK